MPYIIQAWDVAQGHELEIHGCTADHVSDDAKVRAKVECYLALRAREVRVAKRPDTETAIPLLHVTPIRSGWPTRGINVLYRADPPPTKPGQKKVAATAAAVVVRSVPCEA